MALSDALLEFLEQHPGQAYTAEELWRQMDWPGRVFPCHVQQALERRLFVEGSVVASGDVRRDGSFVRASPNTRWCAQLGAGAGFLTYDWARGIREYRPVKWEEW